MTNIFGKIASLFSGKSSSVSFSLTDGRMLSQIFGGPTVSGKTVTKDSLMGLTAAWACQRIIAEALGCLPWAMFERDKEGHVRPAGDHRLADVLSHAPNADMTAVEFREALALNLAQNGNTYALIDRLKDEVVSLYPIESAHCVPKRKSSSVSTRLDVPDGTVFYSVQDRGQWVDYPREKIWHVKGFGRDGLTGLSPIGAARETIGFALATEEFGSRFFSQGGKPSGIVTVPNFFTPDQRKIARENLTQMLGGLSNAHKFALFEGGMKPEPWGNMSLEDMSFILIRKFNVLEMCRLFRVPPHMVAELEKGASFASIEQMSAEFVMYTLLPYMTRFEASVSRWLLPASERRRFFLRINYEGFLRADSAARSAFYSNAVQNGWMSRNEVRAKENLNPVEGLGDYTAQTSLAPVSMLGELAQKGTASRPAPTNSF